MINIMANDSKKQVLISLSQHRIALCYASKGLKDDYEIVKYAVNQNVDNFYYASHRLRNDYGLALMAVKKMDGC